MNIASRSSDQSHYLDQSMPPDFIENYRNNFFGP